MNLTNLASVYSDESTYISALFNREGIAFSEDELLINIDDAWRAIACYMWIDYNSENIATKKENFETLIAKLAMAYFNNSQIAKSNIKGDYAITQISQGSDSMTLRSNVIEIDSNGLTSEVKAALPPRNLRVI